jgi:hypothetical protein
MRAAERANATVASLRPADQRRVAVRRSARVLRDEKHLKNARVAIVLSLFFAFLAAALLVAGRALIDPMLRAAAEAHQAKRMGEVVFTMPDGELCRHLSFNNKTAEVTETALDRCPQARPREKASAGVAKGFAWGAN